MKLTLICAFIYLANNDGVLASSGPSKFESQPSNLKAYPQELMVDLTNRFAFKMLHLHSISNKNNIGFSPCGLASILIALFEGSDGKSAVEIHQALELPWERDIVRVGFRDIHRRLRTYFYKNENILSGLSLSRENITIRPEYETLLRFYGYEVDGISMKVGGGDVSTTTTMALEMMGRETTAVMPETTNADDINNTAIAMSTTTTETTDSTIMTTTTMIPTTTTIITTEPPTMTTTLPPTTTLIFTFKPPTTRIDDITTPLPPITRVPAPTTIPASRLRPTRGSRTFRSKRQSTIIRFPRSPIGYEISPGYDQFSPNFFYPITPYPSYSISAYDTFDQYEPKYPTVATPSQSYQPTMPTDPEEETISHFFYLNQLETIQVPFKYYNTILQYAYIDAIQSSVLELELDSDNYRMMILLPDYDYGLDNLLTTLKTNYAPSLREIKQQMRPEWVKAIVPKIGLRGNIILTNDLQDMGINDIFEPTHADFSPMTENDSIYARHVEQSITLTIRTQSVEQLKRQTAIYKTPVEISVNHPFLFFIIDTEIDVAIMAGRILNPLNSRIQ